MKTCVSYNLIAMHLLSIGGHMHKNESLASSYIIEAVDVYDISGPKYNGTQMLAGPTPQPELMGVRAP